MASERAATMAQYLDILSDENINEHPDADHRYHLRLARQVLEQATDAWWADHEGRFFGGQLAAALDATRTMTRCRI
jgi:Uma2 family endonuclease